MPNDIAPSPAQVPPAAEPVKQQAEPKVEPKVEPSSATAPTPAAGSPEVPPKKDAAAAEPAPATKEEPAPGAAAVLKKEDFKLPEGSLLDPKAVEEIVSLANAKKLSKEAAQEILDRESKVVSLHVEGEKVKAQQLQEKWYADAKADKEIGGEAFDQNVELGFRVVKRFGTPELEALLKNTGAHENPEVLRFIIRMGKAMAPDQLVIAGAGASSGAKLPRLADRIYGPKPEAPAE